MFNILTKKKMRFLSSFLVLGLVLGLSSEVFAATWTQQTASGARYWYGITSSDDGTKLAAVTDGGYIYTSTDSGATWVEQTASDERNWTGITSSDDGTKLAAVTDGGYIYTSTDSGATWVEQTASGARYWYGITSSDDGTKLAAVTDGGYIYTSTDSGATWVEQTASDERNWTGITSSADGTKLAAATFGGYIYTSTDSGATWTERTNSGSRDWRGITSSSDGTKLASGVEYGYIYTSTDSGATWTERTSSGQLPWQSIASSADGTKLAAGVLTSIGDEYIYTSTDSGATWTQETSAGQGDWGGITSSSDGTKLAAAAQGGYIYTASSGDTTPPTLSSFTSTTSNGTYGIGGTVNITANFNEALGASSTMTVVLDTGASVTLSTISGTTLTGTYTVATGNSSSDLTVSSITSASVNDAALNNATSYTVPVAPNNIADTKALVIDGVLPTLTSITSTTTDGSYGIDGSINITATFSEALGSGSTMTVLLNTGASVTLNTVSGSTLTGTYTVTSSNTPVQDLTVTSITSASVNDIPLNNTTSLTLPSAPNNLGDTKAIIVNVGGTVSIAFLQALNIAPQVPSTPPALQTPTSQPTATQPSKYLFTRNLSLNMQGQDVKELQKYLNTHGFTIALQGPGSPGNETALFGPLTKAALIRFQEAYASQILTPGGLTKGTGYFGPSTRGWVNR